jgi:dihydropteroate synthase
MRRILPVVKALAAEGAAISVDTRKAAVAEEAVAAGASIINNVEAIHCEPRMIRVAAESGAGYVAMHMKGSPPNMQVRPCYDDVAAEIERFFEDQLSSLTGLGLNRNQIILDPGIGFGKALEHNLTLLRELKRFTKMERPVLIGLSRKSFLGKLSGQEATNRLAPSIAGAVWAILQGAQILRVHDVAETVQAVRLIEAVQT